VGGSQPRGGGGGGRYLKFNVKYFKRAE
jgi:hypothetical protein